jgi:hypothetical protein
MSEWKGSPAGFLLDISGWYVRLAGALVSGQNLHVCADKGSEEKKGKKWRV